MFIIYYLDTGDTLFTTKNATAIYHNFRIDLGLSEDFLHRSTGLGAVPILM